MYVYVGGREAEMEEVTSPMLFSGSDLCRKAPVAAQMLQDAVCSSCLQLVAGRW